MSATIRVRAGGRRLPPHGAARRDGDVVRPLTPLSRTPRTPIERRLLERLVSGGPASRSDLVSTVAVELYRDAVRAGGWLADVGVLGERLFAPEVAGALDAGLSVFWEMAATSCPGSCCRG